MAEDVKEPETPPAIDFSSWGPRDYVPLPPIFSHWKFLDVGPGGYPHPRADAYLDRDEKRLEGLKALGKQTILGNLEDGLSAIKDKSFDYVWCSHVFEHLADPAKAAATLSRIARKGTLVVPSFAKEALFLFEEPEHRWIIMPSPSAGKPPIFVEHNHAYIEKLRDSMMQKAMCFLLRTGTQHDCTAERYMRGWFQENESALDIVYHWKDELRIQVIR